MSNILIGDLSENILYDFLNIYFKQENNYYVINKLLFKKYEYNNLIQSFFTSLDLYYKKNKKKYIQREVSYNNLLTVLRHICKYKNIPYYSKIQYDKNKYNIIYYISNKSI